MLNNGLSLGQHDNPMRWVFFDQHLQHFSLGWFWGSHLVEDRAKGLAEAALV